MSKVKNSNTLKVLQKNFNGLLSLIYPDNCRICGEETSIENELICFACEQSLPYTYFEKYKEPSACDELFWGRVPIEKAFALLYFKDGNITQKILHGIKYKNDQEIAVDMGRRLGIKILLNDTLSEAQGVVAIPLHSKKEFLRGYNQSKLIAKGISEVTNQPLLELLARKVHHQSQTKKNRFERWENVEDIFEANPMCEDYDHVILVDDVLTTGSTLESACRALKTKNPNIKISLATIAFAQ